LLEFRIAKPIPMKRELKHFEELYNYYNVTENCKAYPDEKGIETKLNAAHRKDARVQLQSLSR